MFLSLSPGAGATSVIRGPYLQQLTPTSVVIVWRTDSASDSLVHYGTDPGNLSGTVEKDPAVTQHEVQIADLWPETRYYYSIGASDKILAGGNSDYFFTTAPPVGKRAAVRIWVLGDSGTGACPACWSGKDDAPAVRDAMLNEMSKSGDIHLWLMLGDNAYMGGTDEEYEASVFEMYPTFLRNYPLWPTLGNHDGYLADSEDQTGAYFEAFVLPTLGEAGGVASGTEDYYSFDYANIHFICLNSMAGPLTKDSMLAWLGADLAETQQDWLIAYWHHPPYSKGTIDSDSETTSTWIRQEVLPILESGGVDLVLNGHSHVYERSFLVNGYYGASSTLSAGMVRSTGIESDITNSENALFQKAGGPNQGTVYVVAGTSGVVIAENHDSHPVMAVTSFALGSLILDVDGDRLDMMFLRETGGVDDSFTILKSGESKLPAAAGCALKRPKRGVDLTREGFCRGGPCRPRGRESTAQ